jgi:endonuclease YncB( thermonuclease family)
MSKALLFAAFSAWVFVPVARSETLVGTVVDILDADTISVSQGEDDEVWVRLAEIDLPEKLQTYGEEARQALSDKLLEQEVRVTVTREDPYGRLIGHIHVSDRWINNELIREGYAWHYSEFSDDPTLSGSEKTAREKGENLWANEDPIPPWEYRELQKRQLLMTLDAFLDKRTRIPDPYDVIRESELAATQAREADANAESEDGTIAVPTGWLSRPTPGATPAKTATRTVTKKTTTPKKTTVTRSRTTYSGSGSK